MGKQTDSIMFSCALVQYNSLPLKKLSREHGLHSDYYGSYCIVGNLSKNTFNKSVSFEQGSAIIEHINENGLYEEG